MRILLVEDDPKIAAGVRGGLEDEGFAVDVAHDGDDGLWMATEGEYDLVVLDIMLPGRNGDDVCRALRAGGHWTPVLMLTAKAGDLDEAAALDAGADAYVTKPFSLVALVANIRALLRRSAGSGSAELVAGDLRVDPVRRRVWRGDVEVRLTARQFDVLEFFARRAGRVLTKDEILRGVWSYDFDGDPNVVEVYVRRVREKIDAPFDRHAIETLRGAGYRLAEDGG